jgi:hypothetical protein
MLCDFRGFNIALKGQCHKILLHVFFMNNVPPSPLKIRGDIRRSRCTTGINNTGGKFATGVSDTGGAL